MSIGNLFFGFNGRINRAKYWGSSLALIGLYILSIAAFGVIGVSLYQQDNPKGAVLVAMVIVFIIWTMVVWFANIAIGAKRLHDRGKSGWWMFLYYVVPTGLQQNAAWKQGDLTGKAVAVTFALAGIGILIWALIDLGFLPGTPGPNAYGPDPLDEPGR